MLIGHIDCCVCGEEVELKESKKGFAYYNCKGCSQVFTRSEEKSAKLIAQARQSAGKENTEHGHSESGTDDEDGW